MIFTLHLQFTPLAPKEQEGIELKEFACFKAYCCYCQITAHDVSDNKTLFAVYYTTGIQHQHHFHKTLNGNIYVYVHFRICCFSFILFSFLSVSHSNHFLLPPFVIDMDGQTSCQAHFIFHVYSLHLHLHFIFYSAFERE